MQDSIHLETTGIILMCLIRQEIVDCIERRVLNLYQEHILDLQSCYSNSEHHRATDRTPTELAGPSRFDLQRGSGKSNRADD